MPISTSMNRWRQIASDIDIDTTTLNNLFEPFTANLAGHGQQEKKARGTETVNKKIFYPGQEKNR